MRLASGNLFPQLRRLDLRSNRLSATGASALWNSPRRGTDLRLDLADNTPPPNALAPDDDGDRPIALVCDQ